MTGKVAAFSNGLLALFFNATAYATIAQNNATSPLTNLYVSLHTADPTSSGTQNTSEISYTGYARVAVARTSGGWTVTSNSVSPAATIIFPASTGGTGGTASFWGIGSAASGSTALFYAGAISPTISISSGVTPELTTASTIVES